jgi:tetratricopeptide (TPR) repeat protein
MIRALLLILLFLSSSLKAQILQDPTAKAQITAGLTNLYQYDFKESTAIFNSLKVKYPRHPAPYLLLAMQWEQQYFPLKDHPAQSRNYLAHLEKAYELAQELYDKDENDLEASFFCTASLGFLAAYEADEQNFMKVVSYAKKAYGFLKIGLKNTDKQPEFLYSTGMYNYYSVAYPELHPVLKPFMFLFQDGNKRMGLVQLEAGTRKTTFVKNECLFYMGYVQNKYEGNPLRALGYNQILSDNFPNNHWYLLQRAELLTLTGKFEEAEPFIEKMEALKTPYYTGAAYSLRGMREEVERKDLNKAESWYLKAIAFPFEERLTKDIRGLAYLGLARIAHREKKAHLFRKYLRISEDFIEYKNSLIEHKRLAHGK